ncbi:MAG: helix-turn-helix domain-containing protein [Armatimonadota bacterium]
MENPETSVALGQYLRDLRTAQRMTLRAVEEASSVSNAYLSQLENGKINKPSPHILHKLSEIYTVSYESLMERAGYISRSGKTETSAAKGRSGQLAAFSQQELTPEEEDELLKYLAFLRTRK